MRIDLKPFCSKDPLRSYIHAPFSYMDHTYATNGHILVRVAREDRDVEACGAPSKKSLDKILSLHENAKFSPIGAISFPPTEEEDCDACDGRGHVHDCPDCECECHNCDGAGHIPANTSVSIKGVIFDCKYIGMIAALPDAEISDAPPHGPTPMPFRFHGGIGALAPCRAKLKHHLGDIKSLRGPEAA